jgi:hypothetical protein
MEYFGRDFYFLPAETNFDTHVNTQLRFPIARTVVANYGNAPDRAIIRGERDQIVHWTALVDERDVRNGGARTRR